MDAHLEVSAPDIILSEDGNLQAPATMVIRRLEGADVPVVNVARPILSRSRADRITLTHELQAGRSTPGCLTCCYAPKGCPCLSSCLPCYDLPESLVERLETSKYVFIRENAVEFNDPYLTWRVGPMCRWSACCVSSCCAARVQDRVTVLYFDDIMFGRVRNKTKWGHRLRTFLCGGRGERLRIDATSCGGMCVHASTPCCHCVPVCCADVLSCTAAHDLWVMDADAAASEIRAAKSCAEQRLLVGGGWEK